MKNYSIEQFKREYEMIPHNIPIMQQEELRRQLRVKFYSALEPGDGVTINLYTDAHAGTVIKRTPKMIVVRRDKAIRVDNNGMSSKQEYIYEPDPYGELYKCYFSNVTGTFNYLKKPISIGRYEYYDYSF